MKFRTVKYILAIIPHRCDSCCRLTWLERIFRRRYQYGVEYYCRTCKPSALRMQVHPTLQKGVKVLQKRHVFYFSPASAEFWEHLAETSAPLHHFTLFLFKINKLSVVQVVVHQWCISGASVVQMEGFFLECTTLKSLILRVKDLVVQVVHSKRLVSHSSFRVFTSIFSCYDYIKNRLFIHILKFVVKGLSVDYVKEFNQSCCRFILKVWHRGTHFRRKLTESGRGFCDQKRVQCSLSYGFIKVLQQIRYLVSCLPPYKTSVWFSVGCPPLHSINWRKIQGVFLKVVSAGYLRFLDIDLRKVGARGGALC